MSAPTLFILFPLALSIILYLLQEKRVMVTRIALGVSFFLALVAYIQPLGGRIAIGSLSVNLQNSISFLGRALTLSNSDRFLLVVIYLIAAFWFGGANIAQTPKMFVPVVLAITAIMVGALAVEPFIYAAVLLELAAILTIPLLLTRNQSAGAGILRFFIYQAIALPVILLAGWMLEGSQASVSNEVQLRQASILLGLGFSFWLAVFPFHPWVPLVMKESHPYSAGFLLCMQSVVYIVIVIDYLNGFIWLRDTEALYPILRTVGAVMVATGGIWAAFQQDVRRLFGYIVIIVNGFALIGIGMHTASGLLTLYYKFLPQMVAMGIFALSLSIMMRNDQDSEFSRFTGAFKQKPFAAGAMILAIFSLAGLPLLASFPTRMEQFELLASVSLVTLIWVLVGVGGLIFAGARLMATMIGENGVEWRVTERPGEIILLGLGTLTLFTFGLFPNIISEALNRLLAIIPYLNL
jgi:formate hydrogenlyase subunit 3/multisubunit Na+/H+ antiporter MnhD subunit